MALEGDWSPAASHNDRSRAVAGLVGALWGVGAWTALIGYAIYRLTPPAIDSLSGDTTTLQLLVAVMSMLAMAFFEGFRGFQQAFSPRVAARARLLRENPTPGRVLLAPLYCAGYIGSSPRRKASIVALTLVIFASVAVVRSLETPWRGIADAAVVTGLSWGMITLLALAVRAQIGPNLDHRLQAAA